MQRGAEEQRVRKRGKELRIREGQRGVSKEGQRTAESEGRGNSERDKDGVGDRWAQRQSSSRERLQSGEDREG